MEKINKIADAFKDDAIIICSDEELEGINKEVGDMISTTLYGLFDKEPLHPDFVQSFYVKGKTLHLIPISKLIKFCEFIKLKS